MFHKELSNKYRCRSEVINLPEFLNDIGQKIRLTKKKKNKKNKKQIYFVLEIRIEINITLKISCLLLYSEYLVFNINVNCLIFEN